MHLQVMQLMLKLPCFLLNGTLGRKCTLKTLPRYFVIVFFYYRLRLLLGPWGLSAAAHLHPCPSSTTRIMWRFTSPPTALAPTKASLSASGSEVLQKCWHLQATNRKKPSAAGWDRITSHFCFNCREGVSSRGDPALHSHPQGSRISAGPDCDGQVWSGICCQCSEYTVSLCNLCMEQPPFALSYSF